MDGKHICRYCGRDCRSPWHLAKHEGKCEREYVPTIVYPPQPLSAWPAEVKPEVFISRHDKAQLDRCPKCLESFKDFYEVSPDTWACLDCGCHFTSRTRLKELRGIKNEQNKGG